MVHVHDARSVLTQELLEAGLHLRVPHLDVMVKVEVIAVQPVQRQPLDLVLDQLHRRRGVLGAGEHRDLVPRAR